VSHNNSTISGILETIKGMNAIDLMELVKAIEEQFGVSAAASFASGGAVAGDEPVAAKEEKTEFKVMIKQVGGTTINVIKAIRSVLPGLGLKEAKDLAIDGAVLKENANKEEAEKMKKALVEAGATIDII
jgi:large subunit ribosomal protein L7/L12